MPAPKGDLYWAKWAYEYCQVAKVSMYPNRDYGAIIDMEPRSVAAMVFRMRARGIMKPKGEGNSLTEYGEALLKQEKRELKAGVVVIDLHLRVKSKEEALADVWDVITQLEHWDPRTGEPFKLKPARRKFSTFD